MLRRVLLAWALLLPMLVVFARPAAAQAPAASSSADPCTPNYAGISRMQGLLHWNHFPLRVAIAPPPDTLPDKQAYVDAALAGFTQWVQATHGVVCYTLVPPSSKQADLTVSLTPRDTVPGEGAAVGYTSMVYCGSVLHCAEMTIATGGATPEEVQTVAAHEFGHALGINGHSDNSGDIMYPSTLRISSQDGTCALQPPHPITDRDLNTLKLCYAGQLAAPSAHIASAPVGAHRGAGHGHSGAALLPLRK